MAINATFKANFDSFYSALDKANVKLQGFESETLKIDKNIAKFGQGFTGTKIIAEAHNMTAAMVHAGGMAVLTDKELRKLGATVGEASEKMKKMGMEVPPGFQKITDATQKLADETRGADKAHGSWASTLKSVAVGLAGLFTARAALNFANDVVQNASALKDLSQQTHINVEEIQLLASAMSEFGVDADTLGKGLFTLSRKIAGGEESVTGALHTMGMSLKDVEGLQGEQLFMKMMKGLSTLQGGLRDSTASDLFGSRLGMAMAGASEGIEGAMDTARRMNTVMSTESVDAMDKYDEAIKRTQRSLSAMAGNMIGPVAEGFNTLTDVAVKGASKVAIAWAIAKDLIAKELHLGTGTEHLAKLLTDLEGITGQGQASATAGIGVTWAAAAAHAGVTAAVDKRTQAQRFMAALEADAAVKLTADQRKQLDRLKELGKLTATNAAAIGVNAAQFAVYTTAHTAGAAATKKWTDEQRRWNEQVAAASGHIRGTAYELDLMHFQMTKIAVLESRIFANRAAAPLGILPALPSQAFNLNTRDEFGGYGRAPAAVGSQTFEPAAKAAADFDHTLDRLGQSFAQLAQTADGAMSDIARSIGTIIASMQLATVASKEMKDGLKAIGEGDKANGYMKLASGIMASVAALDAATNSTSRFKNVAGGAMTGAKIGAAAGPIGAGAGAIVGAIVGWAKSNSLEGKTVSPIRDEFFKLAGALEQLNPKVLAATGSLRLVQDVFNAKTVEQYNAAIAVLKGTLEAFKKAIDDSVTALGETNTKLKDVVKVSPDVKAGLDAALNAKTPQDFLLALQGVNGLLDEQAAKHDRLKGLAEKYGFTLGEMGKEFAQGEIDGMAKILLQDFKDLNELGGVSDDMLRKMAGKYNELAGAAKSSGSEIPESMRVPMQRLVDMGLLVDDTGLKFKDLDGLNFGTTLEQNLKDLRGTLLDLKTTIDDLAAAWRGMGGDAAAAARVPVPSRPSSERDSANAPDGGANAPDGGALGGIVTASGIQQFAGGGRVLRFTPRGTDTVPAMLTPGEVVLTKSQQQHVAGQMGQVSMEETNTLLREQNRFQRRLDERIAIAVRDALLQAGLRRGA